MNWEVDGGQSQPSDQKQRWEQIPALPHHPPGSTTSLYPPVSQAVRLVTHTADNLLLSLPTKVQQQDNLRPEKQFGGMLHCCKQPQN